MNQQWSSAAAAEDVAKACIDSKQSVVQYNKCGSTERGLRGAMLSKRRFAPSLVIYKSKDGLAPTLVVCQSTDVYK